MDAGAGSGQATLALAPRFRCTLAVDLSRHQLLQLPHSNVHRVAGQAESLPLASGSVDLITVAQAVHWFDLPRFLDEAIRVLRSGGAIAVWAYGLCDAGADVDPLISRFYHQTAGPWWPPERRLVDSGLAGLLLPVPEVTLPAPPLTARMTLDSFLGYVGTWSAVSAMRQASGVDPVSALAADLAPLWAGEREVRWPLHVRAGRLAS